MQDSGGAAKRAKARASCIAAADDGRRGGVPNSPFATKRTELFNRLTQVLDVLHRVHRNKYLIIRFNVVRFYTCNADVVKKSI